MRVLATFITIGMLLTPHAVNADVASDVNSNLPIKGIFDNAFSDGLSLEDIFNQVAAANQGLTPTATSYATCNKLDAAETIMTFAFAAAPSLAQPIANAARECGVTEEELLNSALAANIDPTTIGEATAAGGGAGATGAPLAAPSFGSAGGAGGGGTASAG
ncbi:MAG: hypothetical protein OFPI_00550 [Osedax symbiont Rs2]|nr:MAG: hypothetical protein OFPI_00550 [Osedax symbiont Rs2]